MGQKKYICNTMLFNGCLDAAHKNINLTSDTNTGYPQQAIALSDTIDRYATQIRWGLALHNTSLPA